jgi:AcrR family transcriptional regulator
MGDPIAKHPAIRQGWWRHEWPGGGRRGSVPPHRRGGNGNPPDWPAAHDDLGHCRPARHEQRLQDIVDGPDPADDKLERFLATLARAYAEGVSQDPAVFQLLVETEHAPTEAERHRRRIEALVEQIVEEGNVTRLFSGGDSRRMAVLALDLSCRFCEPAMVWAGQAAAVGSEVRRDRVIRWAVRAMSGRK